MLFEQIGERALKRIVAEVKIDVKLASLTLRGRDSTDPTRIAKLRIVEHYIEMHHHIGTIQEPGEEYFRGLMPMQWRWLGNEANTVWFQGDSVDLAAIHYVGLGGSRRHMLGESTEQVFRLDSTGSLIMTLNDAETTKRVMRSVTNSIPLPDQYIMERLSNFEGSHQDTAPYKINEDDLPMRWPLLASQIADSVFPEQIPTRRLKFLAIPLAESEVRSRDRHPVHGVIGTPLYVAIGH